MGKIVDVAINVYGKPYQTLVALKTLMLHSGRHIDKIYFILEKDQIDDEYFSAVVGKFDNIILFTPKSFLFVSAAERERYGDENYRFSLRYQYAWEKTDKDYLFITHNDTFYEADIIGGMLSEITEGEYAGIGEVGQCWNCPAFYAHKCSGEEYSEYDPSYEEIMALIESHPPARGKQFISMIDKKQPMPLPECRLNEFACLINLREIKHEVIPHGTTDPFGTYVGIDLATSWFRDLCLKGYKFKNYDIRKYCRHGWGSLSGHDTLFSPLDYEAVENQAREYYERELVRR